MASFSYVPISFFAFASLLFLSPLMFLSHASIEQPSSSHSNILPVSEPIKPLVGAPHSNILPISEPVRPPGGASHSDILPVSEPVKPSGGASHSDILPVSGFPWAPLLSLGSFYYFVDLWTIISAILIQ